MIHNINSTTGHYANPVQNHPMAGSSEVPITHVITHVTFRNCPQSFMFKGKLSKQ